MTSQALDALTYQGQVNRVLIAKRATRDHPGGGLLTDIELQFLGACHLNGFTPERCAQEILFTRLCHVAKIRGVDGYRVIWGGEVCTPEFNSHGAAAACLSMYATGSRKPELPDTSEGLHSEGRCWGVWTVDATGLTSTCNRCGEERA